MTPNQQLKQWRKANGHTQADFALIMGVTVFAVRKWEQGANVPVIALKLFERIKAEG